MAFSQVSEALCPAPDPLRLGADQVLRTLWWENLCDVIAPSLWVTAHLEAAGSDGVMKALLLPSSGGFLVSLNGKCFFFWGEGPGSCLFC